MCALLFEQGQELSDNGTNGQISKNQCSKLAEIVKDEEILSLTSRDDHVGITKHDSDQCKNKFSASYGARFRINLLL